MSVAPAAAIGGLGVPELIIILVVILVVFGAGRLAGVGKALGTGLREFRQEARPGEEEEDTPSASASTEKPSEK